MITQLRKKNYDGQYVPLGRDRRVMPRYPFTAAAEALDPQSRARMTARTSDISKGGCYIDTFCPFPKNSSVKLRIERDKEFLVAQAKVVYSKVGMGMGLCFTALDQPHKRVLEKWIGELSGSTPAEFADEQAKQHASEAPSDGDTTEIHPSGLAHSRERTAAEQHDELATEKTTLVSGEAGYVLGELIIALMRRGTLNAKEGNSLLHKLVSPGSRP